MTPNCSCQAPIPAPMELQWVCETCGHREAADVGEIVRAVALRPQVTDGVTYRLADQETRGEEIAHETPEERAKGIIEAKWNQGLSELQMKDLIATEIRAAVAEAYRRAADHWDDLRLRTAAGTERPWHVTQQIDRIVAWLRAEAEKEEKL